MNNPDSDTQGAEIEGHYLAGVGAGGSIRPLSSAEKKRHAKAEARIIAGIDYSTPAKAGTNGNQARAVEGSRYVSRPGEAFVRRKFPKVKGKAAAKLAKKQRHAERAEADRRDPARNVDGI